MSSLNQGDVHVLRRPRIPLELLVFGLSMLAVATLALFPPHLGL